MNPEQPKQPTQAEITEIEKIRHSGRYGESSAMDEASSIQKLVESGEAKSYKEASDILDKNLLSRRMETIVDYVAHFDDAPTEEDGGYYPKTRREYYATGGCDGYWSGSENTIKRAIASLDFNDGLAIFANAVSQPGMKEHPSVIWPRVNEFVLYKVTPENVHNFLRSRIADFASPDVIVSTLSDKGADYTLIKEVLNRYEGNVHAEKQNIFGEKSIFRGADTESRKKLEFEAVSSAVGSYIKTAHEEMKKYGYVDDLDLLRKPMSLILNAIENGVHPNEEWKMKLQQISSLIGNLNPIYVARVARDLSMEVAKASGSIERASGDRAEGIEGNGLEFADDEMSHTKKVYLDGSFLCNISEDAQFSGKPANRDTIAWLIREVIDTDSITGVQMQYLVYAIRKGMKDPKIIYQDNAWSDQRDVLWFAPEVTSGGAITAKKFENGEMKDIKLNL